MRRVQGMPASLATRRPIEHATESCPAACDVFVYAVSPTPSVMVRVTVGQAVLPLLFHVHELEPNRVLAVLKGALATAQY